MVTLRAFGSLDARDDRGRPLVAVLAQSKRAALLTYLALSRPGKLHRRDTLLALFWPDLDQAHGRNALSQALSFLRREIGRQVVLTRGAEEVGVDAGEITSDVRTFEEAVAAEDWARALDAYGGDLLEGLQVAGAAPFMDWVDRERERLREAAGAAAWRQAHERVGAGDPTEAERVAQWALTLVPTEESQVRGFIKALADAGDRAAALSLYEKFAGVLAQELDVEPAPETVAVMEAIRRRTDAEPSFGRPSRSGADVDPAEVAESVERSSPDPGVEPARAPPATGTGSWKRPLAGAGLLIALLVGGSYIVRASLTGGPGTLIGEGLAAKYDRVLIADFAASDAGVGQAVTEWLRTEISQSDIVRPVSPAAIGEALRRMNRDPSISVDAATAREIAIRDGYPLVLAGDLERVGAGYLLTARLEEAQSGNVLGRFRASPPTAADLVPALDEMGDEIRARIGESLRSIGRSPPLQQVTTSSLEALRLYTEAVRASDLEAVPLLERAIALDTGFAAAYGLLGIDLNRLHTEYGRQEQLAREAYERRYRLTEYQRLVAEDSYTFNRLINGRDPNVPQPDECDIYEPAMHLYDAYVHRHPDDPRPLRRYGFYQERTGHRVEAMQTYRRLLAMDPSNDDGLDGLLTGQLALGRLEQAGKTLEQWREHLVGSDPWRLHSAEIRLRAWEGDYDGADSAAMLYGATNGADLDLPVMEGDLDAVRGRMSEAFRHYEEGIRWMEQTGYPDLPIPRIANRALVRLVALGDSATATSEVTTEMGRIPVDTELADAWINVGLVYALVGDTALAREALDGLSRTGRGNWSVTRGVLGAALALALGQPRESLDLLTASEIPCTFNSTVDLRIDHRLRLVLAGRAYEALERPDSAITAYQAYFTDPPTSYPVTLDAVFRFDTLERLARLREVHGDSTAAATFYARAADLWREADADLQPRVRTDREKADALRVRGAGQ